MSTVSIELMLKSRLLTFCIISKLPTAFSKNLFSDCATPRSSEITLQPLKKNSQFSKKFY